MSLINDDLMVSGSSGGGGPIEDGSKQKILLQGNDNSNTYSVYGKEVEIVSSKNSSTNISRINASNKIKVNRIVSYEWEQRYNNGQMIAVHKSSQYFAYTIRNDKNGKVRIFHKKLNEKVLLKSFTGRVVDLSFAHYDAEVLLGCVDESGCLQIFKITLDNESKMQTSVVFHLNASMPQSISTSVSMNSIESGDGLANDKRNNLDTTSRIIWCMYIPDNNENPISYSQINYTDASKVFVLTRRNRADIFNLSLIEKEYDCSRELSVDQITNGHLIIDDHKSTILSASFSPDGSAIATSCIDGEVSFYKISFDPTSLATANNDLNTQESINSMLSEKADYSTQPKCLKKWYPHDGKPVTSLYFLDDHKNPPSDAQFWSFILTGADYNREIKLWCCLKWECMQTIRFSNQSPLVDEAISTNTTSGSNLLPLIKSSIDLSSKYVVLSDITRKCFYVLHLFEDTDNDVAKCTAISEFILAYPALSFAIIDSQQIKTRKYNQLNNVNTNNNASLINEDLNSNENSLSMSAANDMLNASLSSSTSMLPQLQNQADSDNNYLATMIRLYCIQTKQLQEMTIFLNGEQSVNAYSNNSLSPTPQLNQTENGMILGTSHMSLNGGSSSSLLHHVLPNSSDSNKLNKSKMNTSISINSDLKSDVEQETFKLKSLLGVGMNKIGGEDSAIIKIVTPPVNSLATPVLMTPDAFLNSPNNKRENPQSSSQPKIEIIQSFMNSSVNSEVTNNPTNLYSSRTSSLTQVTSATNLTTTNLAPSQLTTQSNNSLNKNQTKKPRRRNRKSSSSSNSSTTSSSSSSSSNLDSGDKEIAALSINSPKSSNLLNKVSMENEEDTSSVVLNQTGPIQNEPTGSFTNQSELKVENIGEIKGLLVHMSNSIKQQNEEIERLKKGKTTDKIQSDNMFKKLLANQQKLLNSGNKSGDVCTSGVASSITSMVKNEQQVETIIQQALVNSLIPHMEKVIKEEINRSIQSQMMTRLIDPIREQLAREMAEKMKSIENVLKESVSKLFKSKSTMDSISQSVASSMQGTIVNSYRETFQKVIVPNFEKSCQNMYQQVNSSFAKGTQDYLLEFDQLAKQHRKMFDENKEPILSQMKQYNEHMQKHGSQVAVELAAHLAQFQQQFDNQLRNTNAILQDTIISSVKAIVKEEIHLAMRDQQHTLPDRLINQMRQSGTMTPLPMLSGGPNSAFVSTGSGFNSLNNTAHTGQDTQMQINNFLAKNQFNSAFQVALCAADLNLLMNLCETVNPNQVFEQTSNNPSKKPQCQLLQPVILSLIQQLSQDLTQNIELKLKYLEEAVINLDLSNPLTKEHTPAVVGQLVPKLQQYIQTHPNEKASKQLRMLLMASDSLLEKTRQLKMMNSNQQQPKKIQNDYC